MNALNLAKRLGFKLITGTSDKDVVIEGGYICDLLSWVMSHAKKGDAWITVHTHVNIVAVALLTEVSVIVVPEDIGIEEATKKKAEEEGIVIFSTTCTAYEAGILVHEFLQVSE